MKKGKYILVRTKNAGVFAGYFEKQKKDKITLTNARRIWYWIGAASLSEMAMKGVKNPEECKFPIAVNKVTLLEVIEILSITKEAKKSIEGVPEWKS